MLHCRTGELPAACTCMQNGRFLRTIDFSAAPAVAQQFKKGTGGGRALILRPLHNAAGPSAQINSRHRCKKAKEVQLRWLESTRPRTNCVEESEDGAAVAESECPTAPVEGRRDAGAAAEVNDKLTATQHEETTWSARSWMAFASHQTSVLPCTLRWRTKSNLL